MFYTSTSFPLEAEEIPDAAVNKAPRKMDINFTEKCDIEIGEEVTDEICSDERKVDDSEEEFCEYF